MASPRSLERLLRVRTLQLNLTRAEETRAHEKLASEQALRGRIALLAATIAPVTAEPIQGFSLLAEAHFRERLQQSALAADQRLRVAGDAIETAKAATREARRDQSALEKLIERADADAALAAIRALEAAPVVRKIRHDPC